MVFEGPHCPECKKVKPSVFGYLQAVAGNGGKEVPIVVVACGSCGCILGIARG
jgi:hypothetical protein